MANQICDNAVKLIANGGLDLDTDDLRVLLVGSSFSWDPATDVYLSDIATLDELAGAGYSRKQLTVSATSGAGFAGIDATDVVWASIASGETICGVVIYKFVSDDDDSPIIGFYDVTDTPTNGQSVTLTVNISGLLKISRKSGS